MKVTKIAVFLLRKQDLNLDYNRDRHFIPNALGITAGCLIDANSFFLILENVILILSKPENICPISLI